MDNCYFNCNFYVVMVEKYDLLGFDPQMRIWTTSKFQKNKSLFYYIHTSDHVGPKLCHLCHEVLPHVLGHFTDVEGVDGVGGVFCVVIMVTVG